MTPDVHQEFVDVQPPKPVKSRREDLAGKRTHVVQSGESLWSISRKVYGSDHSAELAEAKI